ncbi:transcription initiation factor IIB family protein [Haloferax volcanii]|uniref:hypothetical protein n=1 Tax=Haloferax volcanii TaxID=2246 RepID=UPI00385443A0
MSDADITARDASCPVCGVDPEFDSEYGFDRVCVDCGFVVDGNEPGLFLEQQRLSSEHNSEIESWVEFASIRNATENRLVTAIDRIDQLGQRLGLRMQSRVRSAELFGQLVINGDTNGRSKERLVTAALYWAERTAEQPIPISVLADICGIEKSSLRDSINTIRTTLDVPATPTTPTDYVTYLSRELELSDAESHALLEHLDQFEAACGGTGRNPVGVAAAAAYQLLNGTKTQAEICDVAGISTETIRIRITELEEARANEN